MNDEEIRLYPWAPPVYMLAFLTREHRGEIFGLSRQRRVTAYFAAQLANDLMCFAEVLNDPTSSPEDVAYALEDVHRLRATAQRRETKNTAAMHAIGSVFRCADSSDPKSIAWWLEWLATWEPWLKIDRADFAAAVEARRRNHRVWESIVKMLGTKQKPQSLRNEYNHWREHTFAFGEFEGQVGPTPRSMPVRPPRFSHRPRRPLH